MTDVQGRKGRKVANVEIWKTHLPPWIIRFKEAVEIDWDSETNDPKSMKKIEQEFMRIFESLKRPYSSVDGDDLVAALDSHYCRIKFRNLEAIEDLINSQIGKRICLVEPKPSLDVYYTSS